MEPKLALIYNSSSGNGQLGVGWGLAGLSTITRCSGKVLFGKVTYSTTDKFCLDGEVLSLRNGVYGAADSVYSTQSEKFSKITAIGQVAGTGPNNFTVRTKDGLLLEFGNTVDSKIEAVKHDGTVAPVMRAWLLNRIQDQNGNYLTVSYTKDTTAGVFNGSYFPNKISYTGNDKASPTVAPNQSVYFEYDLTRADVATWYQANFKGRDRALLNTIRTEVGGSAALKYKLNYENSPQTGRKRLKNIQQCNGPETLCLAPTVVNYPSADTVSIVKRQNLTDTKLVTPGLPPVMQLSPGGEWAVADFRGTGKDDLLHLSGNPMKVRLWASDGSTGFETVEGSLNMETVANYSGVACSPFSILPYSGTGGANLGLAANCPDKQVRVFNMYGDRKGGFPRAYPDGDTWAEAGTVKDFQYMNLRGTGGFYPMFAIKIYVKGKLSIRAAGGGYMGYGSDGVQDLTTTYDTDVNSSTKWLALDLTGDGHDEVVHIMDAYQVAWEAGQGRFVNIYAGAEASGEKGLNTGSWLKGDINGDGLIDMIHIRGSGSAIQTWFNMGAMGFNAISADNPADPFSRQAGKWFSIDYDGDGKSDLIHLADGASGKAHVWVSKGDGSFKSAVIDSSTVDANLLAGRWLIGDIKGTGTLDLIHLLDDSGNYVVWSMPGAHSDIPTSIDGGVGNVVSFTTESLSQMLNRESSSGGSYAYTPAYSSTDNSFVGSLRVVSQVKRSDGLGGWFVSGYNYANARYRYSPKVFSGFESIQVVDHQSGLVETTKYSQQYELIGRPLLVQRGTSVANPANLLSKTLKYSSVCPTSQGGATLDPSTVRNQEPYTCKVVTDRHYYYLGEEATSSWDLDGTAFPVTKTIYSNVDAYGNLGTIDQLTLTATGQSTDYRNLIELTHYNDEASWMFGKVVKKVETAKGPDLPAVVIPGTGLATLPATKNPKLSYLPPQLLAPILGILLGD